MLNFKEKSLIILAHVDDEFAIAPIIKKITNLNSKNIRVLFCAERIKNNNLKREIRRKESIKSLALLGCDESKIDYLNNYFLIDDRYLYRSALNIYLHIQDLIKKFNFTQILTLNYEGGHPDHDSLAILVDKFAKDHFIKKYFFPAYNNRRDFLMPLSVFKPLKTQNYFFKSTELERYCWKESLLIAFIYKSEWKAFIKLFPFILLKLISSRKIYYSEVLDLDSVNWYESFSYRI